MTNIHDIAHASGYSVGTVSRVLNGKKYVAEATRAAILRTIERYDYTPNRIARSLSSGQTLTFGMVVPDVQQTFYSALIRGATTKAFANNYNVILLPSSYSVKTERHYLELLRQRMFDGLIFASHTLPLKEIVANQSAGPIVICHNPEKFKLPAVYATRQASYQQAFSWLQQQTTELPGLVLGRSDPKVSATTRATFTAYEITYQATPPADHIWLGTTYQDGLALGAKIAHNQLTSLLVSSDDVAAGIHQYFTNRHLTAPLLVGQDRQLTGQLLNLPTIDHHIVRLGTMAAELLLSRKNKQIELPSEFLATPNH